MKTLILVHFIIGILCAVIRILEMAFREEWPKRYEVSLGLHLAVTIIVISFVFWAAIVLWF